MYLKIKNFIISQINKDGRLSFAQSGEDLILASILNGIEKGFYIDIGANNPFIQSNTFFSTKGVGRE
jgi:hypothetical protein